MKTNHITVRCVYLHNGGFFAKNKEMPREDFEALKAAIEAKVAIEDATGRIVHAEEAYKTT